MLKALLRKQFGQLFSSFFNDKKTGKRRTGKAAIGYLCLFAVIFLLLGVSFFSMAAGAAQVLIPAGLTWLFFDLMAILAVFLGTFGSVFNTYASLYRSNDNELLLAMPIPPSKIVLVRMIGVYAMGILYESLIYIPTLVALFVFGSPGVLSVIQSILLLFVLGFFIHTLTCLLGWLVALISSKLKNKSVFTAIFSLLFLGVYYVFCVNSYRVIELITENGEIIAAGTKKYAYPLYLVGRAAEGDPLSMLIVTAGIAVLFGLIYLLQAKTFLRLTSESDHSTKAVYRKGRSEQGSVASALLRKEWKRFSSSSTYMLNCGLGTIFMPAAGVASFFLAAKALPVMEEYGVDKGFVAVGIAAVLMFLSSMIDVTAPSISLEGKNLWILRSLPIRAADVIRQKLDLHLLMALPAQLFSLILMSVAFRLPVLTAITMALPVSLLTVLLAETGLVINLKHPDFSWTNEVYPIKQSLGVMICIFGGWAAALAVGGLSLALVFVTDPAIAFLLVSLPLGAAVWLIYRYLMNGAERFFSSFE